jgi:Na+-translocating ferredoxin:NAD+ oxidoreductase RnfD subunit
MIRRPARQGPRLDPRLYQIAVLAGLLAYGVAALHFEIALANAVAIFAGALLAQLAATRWRRLPAFDPRSPLITALSLTLLLRAPGPALAFLTAVAAVASKFVLRWRGKHVFNPSNFGLVFMMLASGRVWVSPGQWGEAAFFAFLMACLGGLVVNRAARSDVTYAFLAAFLAIQIGYALWLGQPVAIPLHRLSNGAFLLFTFFMISDPRTTPDSRPGRILFGALVACGAAFIQLGLFRANGLLFSLALFATTVPLIDRLLPGRRHAWCRAPRSTSTAPAGGLHETLDPRRTAVGLGALPAARP